MELEIRRVQKTGASTMTVSLPKDWIESNSITPGTPVVVRPMPDGTISIDPRVQREKEETRKIIQVDDDETKEHLTRKLIGAYLAGYNIIEVRSKTRLDLELKHAVKEISRMVIGPEVIEETINTVILHDLSDPVELPQEKCVRRMHLIVMSMHKDAIIALMEEDSALAKDVIDRDADVDRLYWMAAKQYNMILKDRKLSEKIGVDIFEGMNLMLVARGIERIGDHAEKMANNAITLINSGMKLGNAEEIHRMSAQAMRILEMAMESYFRKDIKAANNIIDMGDKLVQECQDLSVSERLPANLCAVVRTSVIDSITRTTMYAMDIAEIAINGAMRMDG
ncbi:MAG: phosphate uptake regulator PhoU [Methanomassiliicoccales archaeon]